MNEVRGKVAVVTGAASGIGRELALACARAGKSAIAARMDDILEERDPTDVSRPVAAILREPAR